MTVSEIAKELEAKFEVESIECGDDTIRATLVRAALYLIVKDRTDGLRLASAELTSAKLTATRDVREELADFLHVEMNEVFRLHHHAAGLRAKSRQYRDRAQTLERELAAEHGMEA